MYKRQIESRLAQLDEKLTQEDVYTDVDQLLKINAEKESLDKELLHWICLLYTSQHRANTALLGTDDRS